MGRPEPSIRGRELHSWGVTGFYKMRFHSCSCKNGAKGDWMEEEDAKIVAYVSKHGTNNWKALSKKPGVDRCGKCCRSRWANYLKPSLENDNFTPEEEDLILKLHATLGSRWSMIAKLLPGRGENEVKKHWNSKLSKKLSKMGIDPVTHKSFSQMISEYDAKNANTASLRLAVAQQSNKKYEAAQDEAGQVQDMKLKVKKMKLYCIPEE